MALTGISFVAPNASRQSSYARDGSSQPVTVSAYNYDLLPPEERAALPSPEAITAEVEPGTMADSETP